MNIAISVIQQLSGTSVHFYPRVHFPTHTHTHTPLYPSSVNATNDISEHFQSCIFSTVTDMLKIILSFHIYPKCIFYCLYASGLSSQNFAKTHTPQSWMHLPVMAIIFMAYISFQRCTLPTEAYRPPFPPLHLSLSLSVPFFSCQSCVWESLLLDAS